MLTTSSQGVWIVGSIQISGKHIMCCIVDSNRDLKDQEIIHLLQHSQPVHNFYCHFIHMTGSISPLHNEKSMEIIVVDFVVLESQLGHCFLKIVNTRFSLVN